MEILDVLIYYSIRSFRSPRGRHASLVFMLKFKICHIMYCVLSAILEHRTDNSFGSDALQDEVRSQFRLGSWREITRAMWRRLLDGLQSGVWPRWLEFKADVEAYVYHMFKQHWCGDDFEYSNNLWARSYSTAKVADVPKDFFQPQPEEWYTVWSHVKMNTAGAIP
jgi:hypothetical protein